SSRPTACATAFLSPDKFFNSREEQEASVCCFMSSIICAYICDRLLDTETRGGIPNRFIFARTRIVLLFALILSFLQIAISISALKTHYLDLPVALSAIMSVDNLMPFHL